ncbi:hypothetical protein F4780DRAFT_157532 [Xylariomycetidae sp. FL0641]|nr:hypothetical protein F4780DRAFT_157532 [Xylariomycetidae sp. FL0641]
MRRPNYAHSESSSGPRPPPPVERIPIRYMEKMDETQVPERTFNGPIRYLELGVTLHSISGTRGGSVINRNVLFAASNLRSASTLLPVACQMASELKNYVHFALFSRSDIALSELRSVNGLDDSCHVIFHDARPDYPMVSTDERLERAAFRAFHHIGTYMHPQSTIIDSSDKEEGFFRRAAREHAEVTKSTLLEMPLRSAKTLEFITKMDSAALRMWDKNHIDILVHAEPGASGSLIRLLRSLSSADYTSGSMPHLTIELPHDIDPPTKKFLEDFKWPPEHIHNPANARLLSLRHRIPHQRMTEEESSVRFLESFWPAQPQNSHILVLSPQTELSPSFYQYLKYTLLEYQYSPSSLPQFQQRLFGISLEQPSQTLDGGPFSPPSLPENSAHGTREGRDTATSYLWQAPASNAVLFLGEKWMELHDFVSRSLEAQGRLDIVPEIFSKKLISKQHPSWLEHALRLCRARGYWMLYPGNEVAANIATVHNELSHWPEEYAGEETPKPLLSDDASDEEVDNARQKARSGIEIPLAPVSLLESLPDEGRLRPLHELPVVSWDGTTTNYKEVNADALAYTAEFRTKIGGCDPAVEATQVEKEKMSAQDLFCTAKQFR